MASALRREAAALADGRRLRRELEAAHALAAEREADSQRLKLIVKLRDGQVARLEVCASFWPARVSFSTKAWYRHSWGHLPSVPGSERCRGLSSSQA